MVYHQDTLNPVEVATSSFGQGVTVTMMQLGTAFCSAINGGYYYQPHVVKQVLDADGNLVKNYDRILVRRTISEETSDQMKTILQQVVENGTGKKAMIEGYEIGGKTGTAEKLPRGNHKYLVSFIGFAPVDDPQVVVYVVVDEPGVGAIGNNQAHSSFAQEICHEIFKQILPYMGVESSLSEEEEAEAAASLTEQAQAPVEEATDDTPETEAPEANPEAVPEPDVQE